MPAAQISSQLWNNRLKSLWLKKLKAAITTTTKTSPGLVHCCREPNTFFQLEALLPWNWKDQKKLQRNEMASIYWPCYLQKKHQSPLVIFKYLGPAWKNLSTFFHIIGTLGGQLEWERKRKDRFRTLVIKIGERKCHGPRLRNFELEGREFESWCRQKIFCWRPL